jgi:hypothetical protein
VIEGVRTTRQHHDYLHLDDALVALRQIDLRHYQGERYTEVRRSVQAARRRVEIALVHYWKATHE